MILCLALKFSVDVGVIGNMKKLELQLLGEQIIQDRVVKLEKLIYTV